MTAEAMRDRRARLDAAGAALRARVGSIPDVAIVLGSGLGAFADRLEASVVVPSGDLPDWPVSAVTGHAGKVAVGTVAGRRVLVLAGRVHLYEGHPVERVVFPVRALPRARVRQSGITHAGGGIKARFASGTLMVIDDHLNLTGQNPLVGPHDPDLGRRFPDMTEVYARRLRRLADESAGSAAIPVAHGVYAGVLGPSYETPAEIRAFRALGADAVGMSTVVEAIAARHLGAEVLGISCIANMAAGIEDAVLTEEDVLATSARVQGDFCRLLEGIIGRL